MENIDSSVPIKTELLETELCLDGVGDERPIKLEYDSQAIIWTEDLQTDVKLEPCEGQFVLCSDELSEDEFIPTATQNGTTRQRKSSNTSQGIKCSKCPSSFATKNALGQHIRIVHADPNVKLKCRYCPKHFKCRLLLNGHIKKVHNNFPVQCHQCPEKFRHNQALQYHVEKIHCPNLIFLCKLCSYSGKTLRALQTHVSYMHKEPKFSCTQCDFKCRHKQVLENHILRLHNANVRNFACRLCKADFKTKHDLYGHTLRVHKIKGQNFQCDFCKRKYKLKKTVARHIKDIHLPMFLKQ